MGCLPKPRVHFINRFFYPDLSATSSILQGIAFDLAAQGHAVHVTTSQQLYEDASARLPRLECIRGVTIHRIPSTRFGRSSLVGRAIDYATFYASAACHLIWVVKRRDVLIAKTDPPLISVVAAAVARIRGALLVNWLQDIFPEVATAADLGGRWARLPLAGLRVLRNWSLATARRNVVIGERMAEYLASLGIARQSLVLIPNWADPDIIHPIADNPLLDEWGLRGRIVVAYSGNLGRVHEVPTLTGAIEDIVGRGSDPVAASIMFVFIGGGAMRAELEREIESRRLGNVRLFPYQPINRLAETLAVADLHLVSLRPEQEGFVVPSKIYGVMAAARPTLFIGASDGEVARLVQGYGMGKVVAAGDSRALSDAILDLAKDQCQRMTMGAAARAAFDAGHTRQASVRRWAALLADLGDDAPARVPGSQGSANRPVRPR